MNLILIGMMGAGKSTVGRMLAETLGRPLLDTDAEIEREAGQSVAEIFAAEGETGFRRRESAIVAALAARSGFIVATGGGVVLAPSNRDGLRRAGVVVWLYASPEELLRRTRTDGGTTRPLLAGSDPLGRLQQLVLERTEAYRAAADHCIGTDGLAASSITEAVLKSCGTDWLRGLGRSDAAE